jgi:hypothetical protein
VPLRHRRASKEQHYAGPRHWPNRDLAPHVSPGRPRAPTISLWKLQRQPAICKSHFGPSGLRGFARRPAFAGAGSARPCCAQVLADAYGHRLRPCGARCGWQAAAAQPARRMRRETPASTSRATWLAHASAQIPRP